MAKGLGIAGLVLAIVAIFTPVVSLFVTLIAMVLVSVAALFGDRVFAVAAVTIGAVNTFFLSPLTLVAMVGEAGGHGSYYLLIIALVFLVSPIVAIVLNASGKLGPVIHEAKHGQSMPVARAARASPGQAAKAQIGKIRILNGALAGMEVPLSAKVILGRDPTKAQIVFPSEDISVSRQHCEIQFDSAVASFAVRDLGSLNGTFIANGANPPQRLAPNVVERVALGKNILVGSYRNRLVLELG
jgi:FHA domain